MNWTTGEVVWLGTMAIGATGALVGGIRSLRMAEFRRLPRAVRETYIAGVAGIALGLVALAAGIVILNGVNQ